ncbi:MAG TPA: alpha/beta hydrolase domain-containing protein [Pseudolysinimonas sp.]|nr:alpha/beta hydrolase domain-containing protein [Pseudolysinimonas sp.]
MNRIIVSLSALLLVASVVEPLRLSGQGPGGPGGPGGRGPVVPVNLPSVPTAVTMPTVSEEITGPGPMFDSTPSLPPGQGLSAFRYEAKEYFVSGTANGQPYKTRLVVRRPARNADFSGLVLAESMHGSGSAHMFEFTSTYTMSSGHAAVEILTTSPAQFVQQNQARYKDLQIAGGQASEILAQVGALVRTGKPLGGLKVRKMVLAGTSMSAGTLINYLPAHRVFRTPEMQNVYDGFYPTSNGSLIPDVDVPVVHLPTMLEVAAANITDRADSDEPGKQYRMYQVAGMAHIDTRDSVRLKPNPCTLPLSDFPHQAYVAVGLHHLLQWVDKGIAPPRAERIARDNDEQNDGSRMTLDEHGNPRGGIRTPYVDVPIAKYGLRPPATSPVIPNASAYVAAGGQQAANQMCGLSGTQVPIEPARLKELYKTKKNYASMFEKRVKELEKAGWSLPLYRELIVGDAAKVNF